MRRVIDIVLSLATTAAVLYLFARLLEGAWGIEIVILSVLALLLAGVQIARILDTGLRRTYRPLRRKWNMQCVVCGYSLIGNVSGVCPECGTNTLPR